MPGKNSKRSTSLDREAIYQEASEIMNFSLPDEIASTRGLQALVNALSEHQRLHVRVVKLHNKVERRFDSIALKIKQNTELYKLKVQNLMVVNPDIRKYKLKGEREVAAQTECHQDLHDIHVLQREKAQLKALLNFVAGAKEVLDKGQRKLHDATELAKVQAHLTRQI